MRTIIVTRLYIKLKKYYLEHQIFGIDEKEGLVYYSSSEDEEIT